MEISDNGSWLGTEHVGKYFDRDLANEIVRFCWKSKLETILDLGCGDGSYVKYFNDETFLLRAVGCDGNPNTAKFGPHLYTADLSKLLFLKEKRQMDLILSLEVGEHIPVEYEWVYLENVVRYAKEWIILSWAIPGQTGDGHVNCRSNAHILTRMLSLGFEHHRELTQTLRLASSLPWFKNTLMVFKRII